MKKFMNDPETFIEESLKGFALAHADICEVTLNPSVVTRRTLRREKVGLVSGGGSGHEPMHTGFVGRGMLDAACRGQIFTSPTPDQMMEAARLVDTGAGVLFIIKNYSGDRMNFEMAAEMSEKKVAMVVVDDDVAVEDSTHTTGRRGVAGTVIVEKLVGSLAESGANLEACVAFAERITGSIASMGVAFSSCTVPAAGRPTFLLADDEMEFGVGIHGEPGRRREKLAPTDEIVAMLLESICDELKPSSGSEVLLLVNGLGSTPLSELYLVMNSANKWLNRREVTVARSLVGNYTTALEMAGISLTLCKLDEEMKIHWDAPVHTAALRW
ncbi:dihydroxyacetone kinase subunit DhaK [Caballeronia glebae]|uniref:dihydroxyacetone kinase subunit DhaK n=1 Tax=Caballeronia glebae TaxID=1777143 RepID=UPI0038B8654D